MRGEAQEWFPVRGRHPEHVSRDHGNTRGRLRFDLRTNQLVVDETFQVFKGPSTTDGDVVFYGTLDGWFEAADEGTPKELYKFHAPSGILGNR